MHPTERGAALLDALTQPHIKAMLDQHAKPLPGWKPDDRRRTTATAQPTTTATSGRNLAANGVADQLPTALPPTPAAGDPDP